MHRLATTTSSPRATLFLLSSLFFGLLSLLSPSLAPPCLAQNSRLYLQEAKNLYKQGYRLVRRKLFKRALIKFNTALNLIKQAEGTSRSDRQKAYHRKIRVTLLYFVGRTYHLDRQYPKAYKYYNLCLLANPPPQVEQQTKEFLSQVMPRVKATIRIQSKPKGAQVRLFDSQGQWLRGTTPFTGRVSPGKLSVILTLPGYQRKKLQLEIEPVSQSTRTVQLISSDPVTSGLNRRPPPQRTKRVAVAPIRRPASPPRQGVSTSTILGWSGVGLAVIAAGVGVPMLILGINQADGIEPQRQKDLLELDNSTLSEQDKLTKIQELNQKYNGILDQAVTFQTIGWILLGVSVVATIGGVVFLTRPKPQANARISQQHPRHRPSHTRSPALTTLLYTSP